MRTWVFLGDSHFRGTSGYDVVSCIRELASPKNWHIVNAGVNADLTWNALQRLDAVIETHPDRVSILLGTNDVNAALKPDSIDGYRRDKGIMFQPSAELYRSHLNDLLQRLQSETDAQIQIIELPPIEVDHSDAMTPISAFRQVQRELAASFGCVFTSIEWGTSKQAPAAVDRAQTLHDVDGWDWDRIRDHFGFGVTVDGLHLSESVGKLLCSSILTDFPP
jgi:lysophospholipase L1-like esterase